MVTVRGGADRSRYGVLETLRAYGRERLRENGIDDRYAARHAEYYTELAERAAAGLHGADERAWVERMLPDYDNLRAAFERAMADRDIDLALRLVTSLPELVHLRVGYEAAGWAERALELADPDHPLFAAAVGFAARGAWNRGELLALGRWPRSPTAAFPAAAPGASPTRRTCSPTSRSTRATAAAALAHYDGEVARARRDADPIRLVWTLFYVAICHAALRTPEAGLPAAQEAVQVAETTANPTARSMADYALGSGAQEVRAGACAGAVRRGGRAGRVGAELLVARHRADGGRGDPRRARRPGDRGADASSRCSTTGTGSATGPSSGSTCAT